MINLLIVGYHGYGNCGDEATLMAMTTNIKKIAPDVCITAISHNPELTKKEYNINSIQRFNIFQLIKTIIKSDIVLSGGGTLIQNSTSTRSLLYYLSIIKFAKILNKKVILYSNGIGPVNGKLSRYLVRSVINNVNLITLREEFSEEDLKKMGVKKPEIFVTADACFTLKPIEDSKAKEILKNEGIPLDKDIIGVSIRSWNKSRFGDKHIKEIAKACNNMAKEGKTILLIPMQHSKDLEVSKKVINLMEEKAYLLKKIYAPYEVAGIIGQTKLILSMRLHSLIFAGLSKVPMIGIVYDPKIEYYLKVLNMPSGGDIRNEKLDGKKLTAQMQGIFFGIEKYKDILNERVNILIKKANQNENLLLEQLNDLRKNKKRGKNEK